MGLVILIADGIYLDLSEARIDPLENMIYPSLDFQRSSIYSDVGIKWKYPGDTEMRKCTS